MAGMGAKLGTAASCPAWAAAGVGAGIAGASVAAGGELAGAAAAEATAGSGAALAEAIDVGVISSLPALAPAFSLPFTTIRASETSR